MRGTGFVLTGIRQAFPLLSLSASDIQTEGLFYAAQRLSDVTFFQMDARDIPFEAEFDVIGAFDVLEHIADDELVLAQLFQAVKPGGGLMLSVPQHPFLWSFLDEFGHHKRRYTRSELIEKISQAGFEMLYVTSFVALLLPLLLLSRLTQRRPKDNFDPMAEFKINPLLNQSLEKVLAAEGFFIRRGISFPAGGSLLAVAKRPDC
jgi:SAM-dependent methyltransferase